ncbi:MAG: hypothetical protein IKS93_01580, partial [Methanobrevibacter sp.]|nr:hypothetical protein [Methanobrevibacter sp.]
RNFLEEEVEKRFTEEYDEKWGIYLSDNLTGDWYNINPVHIVDTCNKLWEQVVKLIEENEQLRKELNKPKPEKRFEPTYDDGDCVIDNETKLLYHTESDYTAMHLAELMNEQDKDIKQLKQLLKEAEDEIERLKESNKGLLESIVENDSNKAMLIEFLSNIRKNGFCEGCKNKDKPIEWYIERGLSITAGRCDRYEPEDEDNQETEVRECSFCGEFRTEYEDPDCYGGWTSKDFCNAGHELEDSDPNSCKDYWDKF